MPLDQIQSRTTEIAMLPGRSAAFADEPRAALADRVSTSTSSEPRVLCGFAARLAADHYEVTLADIGARTRRSRRATRARHVAIYLAHVAYGLKLGAVAASFGRSRRAAAYACQKIEDARDQPAFDAALARLELTAGVFLGLEKGTK